MVKRGWMTGVSAAGLAVATAAAAVPLYSNASSDATKPALSTGTVSGSGVAAPAGSSWSELQKDAAGFANAIAGFSAHAVGAGDGYRFADDFVVPAGGWRLTSAWLYMYQSGAPATAFPITGVTVRVWSGRPGDAGSRVIWGDVTTNRMTSHAPAGIYRIFSSTALPLPTAPDALRMVWRVEASLGNIALGPGRYWLDWQYGTIDTSAVRALAPAATVPGLRGVAGANAIQLGAADGAAWTPVVDTGKPDAAADVAQDLAFILIGTAAPPPCWGDVNGDFLVDGRDLSILLSNYGASVPAGTGGDVNNSGRVDGADLSVLLTSFGNPC